MKKIRGDKPFGVIMHTYMEILQGIPLCSYLYLKQAKMSYFSFYLFPFIKLKNRRAEQVCPEGGLASVEGGRCWGNGVGG
jgi:hypothetical protein